jgi:hypothetical protein
VEGGGWERNGLANEGVPEAEAAPLAAQGLLDEGEERGGVAGGLEALEAFHLRHGGAELEAAGGHQRQVGSPVLPRRMPV